MGRDPRSIDDRFWSRVDMTSECWTWTGSRDNHGYGSIGFLGKKVKAHRLSYALLVGEIPEGLTLDHLCRNRACVRPEHLEPVTMRENTLRGIGIPAMNAAKVACPHCGGPYILNSRNRRVCPPCRGQYNRTYLREYYVRVLKPKRERSRA